VCVIYLIIPCSICIYDHQFNLELRMACHLKCQYQCYWLFYAPFFSSLSLISLPELLYYTGGSCCIAVWCRHREIERERERDVEQLGITLKCCSVLIYVRKRTMMASGNVRCMFARMIFPLPPSSFFSFQIQQNKKTWSTLLTVGLYCKTPFYNM
jgi:hypothetical protein